MERSQPILLFFKLPYGEVGIKRDSSMIASFVLPHDRTSPSVELYFILGHQLSRKSPATHLEDEITKRNAVNEKPGNGQATGLVALGLGRADIGIVNDDPLLVRPIGLLSKIRVFDIRVGSLIRASKPPCCHFSWIGCIRL